MIQILFDRYNKAKILGTFSQITCRDGVHLTNEPNYAVIQVECFLFPIGLSFFAGEVFD